MSRATADSLAEAMAKLQAMLDQVATLRSEAVIDLMTNEQAFMAMNKEYARRLRAAKLRSRFWLAMDGTSHAEIWHGEREQLRAEMAKWPAQEKYETRDGSLIVEYEGRITIDSVEEAAIKLHRDHYPYRVPLCDTPSAELP